MSLDAAIGRIGQIIQLQQQVDDPIAAASGSSHAAGQSTLTSGGGAATSATTSSFADLLAGAQDSSASGFATSASLTGAPTQAVELTGAGTGLTDPISSGVTDPILSTTGLASTTGLTGGTGLTATSTSAGAPAQLLTMTSFADSVVGKPYVWGGGHGDFGPQPGYDCSGFVSAVLHAGGYLSAPQDTQTLPDQAGIENGPGQYVTIYDRTDAGSEQDHVIIDLGGQFYESGGGHGAWGGGGGVEKIGTPKASYLASFNRVLHPEGM